MSVSSETTKSGPFTLNGVTTTFGYGFKILDEDDIEFVKLATSDGEMTVLTITSVTGVGDAGGKLHVEMLADAHQRPAAAWVGCAANRR